MKTAPRGAAGAVRIIGGRWRGTRLPVDDAPGLRPSSDRVRETLFNWLGPMITGARVVDLFAGTGALGLEAVSRGASSALLVERDARVAARLNDTVSRLAAEDRVKVVQADALQWLAQQPPGSFDIAFLDPPFDSTLWSQAMALLLPAMASGSLLYVESPHEQRDAQTAAPWLLHRQGSTRDVRFALYRKPGQRGADTLAHDDPAAASE